MLFPATNHPPPPQQRVAIGIMEILWFPAVPGNPTYLPLEMTTTAWGIPGDLKVILGEGRELTEDVLPYSLPS